MNLTVNLAVRFRSSSLVCLLGLCCFAFAQVEVNSTLTPDEYVNDVLLGSGVVATNVQLTGSPVQIGHITGFDPADFPIEAGLILSTEVANNPANVDDGCMDQFDNLPKLKKVYGAVATKTEKYLPLGAIDCAKEEALCAKYGGDKPHFGAYHWVMFKDRDDEKGQALFTDFAADVVPEDNDFMNAIARATGVNRWEL